jgi:phosphohistidine phosphatase
MMQVYLLRHGIAEDGKPGVSDAERALTSEGRRKLRHVLELAAEAKVKPDLILSSPLKRAVQTAAMAREVFGHKEKVAESRALLPGSSADETWKEIRAHEQAAPSLLLVGHNPLFAELAAYLLGSPDAQVEFKKGAMMRIDFDSVSLRPKGVLRWYLTAALASHRDSGRGRRN